MSGENMQRRGELPHELFNMFERRSQLRIPDSDLVLVSWDDNGVRLNHLGNVKDISRGGIGILVDRIVAVGTRVTISYGEGELAGVVRHKSELIDGHLIGIELAESSRNAALRLQVEPAVRSR
jgi:hypothetical protein